MLILHYSLCFHRTLFFCSSFPPKINQKASVLGIEWSCCKGFVNRRCSSSSLVVCAVDKESDFEVDPVKAREALRELDDQLQSIAQKQIDPPKVRASRLTSSTRDQNKEGIGYDTEISGTFLTYAASGLLLFTIFYNILFVTVIKPAIDGPDMMEDISSIISIEKAAPSEQFSSKRGTSVEP